VLNVLGVTVEDYQSNVERHPRSHVTMRLSPLLRVTAASPGCIAAGNSPPEPSFDRAYSDLQEKALGFIKAVVQP